MDYVITDKGIKLLLETGFFADVSREAQEAISAERGHFYFEDIDEYLRNHRSSPRFREKLLDELEDNDEFRIFSFMYANDLVERGKIPSNLPDNLMTAISGFVNTEKWTNQRYRHNFRHINDRFITCVNGDTHGDFFLQQYNYVFDDSEFLFPEASPLVKKLKQKDIGKLYGHYDYWTGFLEHLILYSLQIKKEVPFRENFEEVFYRGNLPSETPGMVLSPALETLKFRAKEKKIFGIPLYPGWKKQRDSGWSFTGQIEKSRGFIMDGNLVYCDEDSNGNIEFGYYGKFSSPRVFITPDMIKPLMIGTITLIRDGAGRNQPQDPGLIMKYFPYDLF